MNSKKFYGALQEELVSEMYKLEGEMIDAIAKANEEVRRANSVGDYFDGLADGVNIGVSATARVIDAWMLSSQGGEPVGD